MRIGRFERIEIVFFAAALLLYLPGLWWGLPYATAATRATPWGSDELAPLQSVTEVYGVFFARHPSFNPQYPLFENLMQLVLVGPYVFFAWITGHLRHPQPLYPFGFTDPVSALRVTTLLSRAVNWLMAAGVVVAAYRTGVVLKDRLTGIISGILVLSIYPMFYYSRTSNVDMGALFWTALGLLVFARSWRDGLTTKRAIRLGVYAALATATKDASWAPFLVTGLVLACTQLSGPHHRFDREKMRPFLLGLLVAAAVYVTASGLVFRPSRWIAHMKWISGPALTPGERALTGAGGRIGPGVVRETATIGGYANLVFDIGQNLVDSFGVPMAVCVAAGIVLCGLRGRRMLQWLLPAAGIVVLVLVPARFILIRYVIAVAYILSFFAALALRAAWERMPKAAPVLLGIVVIWSLMQGGDLTWQMLRDPRYEAGAWFHQHARPGDRVLHFACACGLPPLDAGIQNVASVSRPYDFTGTAADPEFVLLVPYELLPSEPLHERALSDEQYQALHTGSLGYRPVFRIQTSRLFSRRPLPWVNPPVEVFVRNDVMARLDR